MSAAPERVGNYLVFPAFAKGGMATVHLARVAGSAGFRRIVVVKRMLPSLVADAEAAARLLLEARLSSRVRSPYVVPTVDVIEEADSLLLAMDLIEGITLGRLLALAKTERPMPPAVAVAIMRDVLRGLHSAHEATAEDGTPLEIVHRDITPQNVMIGSDGKARIVDFGIAKAFGQSALTATGEIRGTLGYIAPEQLRGSKSITRAADLYSAGVVLWEMLTGKRLRAGPDISEILREVERGNPTPPSATGAGLPAELDRVVLHALSPAPSDRPATAEAMRLALERALAPASEEAVRQYVEEVGADEIEQLRERVRACELYEEKSNEPARTSVAPAARPARIVGRYVLHDAIASGGMATVHLGRLEGPVGFARTVAIKRLHPHLANDRRFTSMLLDEARLLVRVRHPNVVSVLDIVEDGGELLLVMDYVHGETLSSLLDGDHSESAPGLRLPPRIACAIIVQALHGLHAAHESRDERGKELGLVHRDFSPHNIIVGFDGVARVLDFGIAKAAGRIQETRDGELKGKVAYMAPELLGGGAIDRRADIWGAGLVLSEMLTGERMFESTSPGATMTRILDPHVVKPSTLVGSVPSWLDDVVVRGLARDPNERFPTALAMALAIEEHHDIASTHELGEWMRAHATERSRKLGARLAEIESGAAAVVDFQAAAMSVTPPAVTPPQTRSVAPPRDSIPTRVGKARGAVAAIVVIAVAVSAALSSVLLSRSRTHEARGAEVVPDPVLSAPSSAPPPPTASSAPVASSTPPVPSATAAHVDAGRIATPKRPHPAAEPKNVRPAPTPSCDPPYTVDANGFRVPKPDCI